MKHSKLFLTGMAALLSFGLMMTGCDSGGDSDSNTGPAAGDYISIEETTPGADTVAAVYTVTVKQSLANKVVTFTNVADDDVVYGPPANTDNTPAKQATAIVAKLNDADGAKYIAAQTDNTVAVFTLTAPGNGEVTAKPDFTIETYTAPPPAQERISDAFTVAENDNALKITGTTTTAAFKDGTGIKVYIKDDGKEALITDETSAPTGYTAPSGTPVLIAEHDATSGKPVLWVKGLTAAVTPVVSGKLISGTADVTVKIAVGAQTGDVGAVAAPVSGKATVLPTGSGPYTLVAANAACSSAGNLALVNADNTINYYDGSGSATSPALNDAAGFNAQLFSVLKAATSGLAVGDKITVDAKGIITGAEITVATPSAAKINAVLGVLDNVTIGASGTGLAAITIPASKTLKVAGSGVLGLASSDAALTITGTLLVDDGNNNTVTIEKAVITPAAADAAIGTGTTGAVLVVGSKVELAAGGSITAAGTATFTVGSGNTFALEKGTVANPTNASVTLVASNGAAAGGTVVLPAATTLTLENGGAITIVGTGTLTAGLTTFGGAGLWTASGAAVTITGNANGAIITAPDGTAASTLTGTGTAPAITQNTGAGNVLTIEAGVTLDTTAASIVLKSDASNPGKLVLAPKSGSAAHGGGAKLVINSSSATDASVAKSGQTAANLTATGTAAAALTFTATANTVITNIPANSNAATIKSLEAATSQNTDGTITLIGYSSDVTVSAAATFEYHA